jgi:hypothetical protein
MPLAAFSRELGWSDLVATAAVASGRGETTSTIRDKKARTLRAALERPSRTLGSCTCQALQTNVDGTRGLPCSMRRDGNLLATHCLTRCPPSAKTTSPFRPVRDEWLAPCTGGLRDHTAPDGCMRPRHAVATSEADISPGEVAIPAEVRLRRYGIHRDPFSAARKTLEWFGLLDVRE